MQKFQLIVKALLISLTLLFLAGCPKKPCPDPLPPEVIVIEPEYKVYPIEPLEPLESVTIYPLTEPGIVGGIKDQDIKAIQRNILRLMKWGIINQSTIEEVNKLSKEKGEGE